MFFFQLATNTHTCLLLLVYIPDSSSVLCTHKPTRNWVYLFIMMLSFQLSKVDYVSTQLLVYMPTEAPVHQPTSSFFPFGLTCARTCELICWSMYPQTYLPKINVPVHFDPILQANHEDLPVDSTPRPHTHRWNRFFILPVHFEAFIPTNH